MNHDWQETLFRWWPVRWALAILFLCRGTCYQLLGRRYRALDDFCWVVRVGNVRGPQALARALVFRAVEAAKRQAVNPVVEAFRADPMSARLAASYALSGSGASDLFRDLIVLKSATSTEKGVILLKYARTFSATMALLDVQRLMQRYVFVLEPCWSGYCHPAVLMFISSGNPVPIQCFTEEDHSFIVSIGAPLIPIRLGPADWVNTATFEPVHAESKPYDLVMVANWARHKRHEQLFRALRDVRDRKVRVLLVGFAWHGRTADDIRREAAALVNDNVTVEILEKLPQPELARYLAQCKVFVFLSRKEGDNKALVEAMFADLPVIVFRETIGGAGSRVNPATGVLASDHELTQQICYMLDHHEQFSPRAWAVEHTGSKVATAVLNDVIRGATTDAGNAYRVPIVEKMNAPNLAYRDSSDRSRFAADYAHILDCRLDPASDRSMARAAQAQ